MISSGELRKGIIIELEGKLYQVLDYQHIKMKKTALNRLKLRDIRGGHTIEQTFQASEKFVRARLDFRSMQYLYSDGDLYHFMDKENFEQLPLSAAQLGDTLSYLKEGMSVEVSSYKGELVGVELPITVELEIIETEPGFKGDTATAGNKPAKLETGITIQVPLFINTGDIIKVDTRDGSYLERV
ncbi:Elongation factor P [subsurface metagenome]